MTNLFYVLPAYLLASNLILHPATGGAEPNLEVRRELALDIEETSKQAASKDCDWFNYLTSRNNTVHKYAPVSEDEWVLIWKEDFAFGVFLYFEETCRNDAIRFLSGVLREIHEKIGHDPNAANFARSRHVIRQIARFLQVVTNRP